MAALSAISAGVDDPLGRRLAGLTFLRLLVLTALLAFIEFYYVRESVFGDYSSRIALITVAAGYFLSGAFLIALRLGAPLVGIAHMQLVADQLTWTALVYVSGGVTSGTTSLYGLTCVAGAILLGPRGAATACAAGVLTYGSMCWSFASGWLAVPSDGLSAFYIVDFDLMVYPAVSTILATTVVALLAGYLGESMLSADGRLRVAKRRAEDAEEMAVLGRLAAALAHEIRNPLGSIRGSVELLRTGNTLSAEDQELCALVERETRRLNDLVSDMVDLGRPRTPEPRELNLPDIAKDVVQLAKLQAGERSVSVRYTGPLESRVEADGDQIRQVIWNLVRNAIQVTPDGGSVTIDVTSQRNEVRLLVSDEGPGIADQDRAHIFDAFFSTRAHGVGIGLAVVKRIVEAHGFSITAENKDDGGAEFKVTIPTVVAILFCAAPMLLGCSGSQWVENGESPRAAEGDGSGWSDSQPVEAPSKAAPNARPSPPPGPPAMSFRNTYYDFPGEPAQAKGATKVIYGADCKPIATVPASFHDQVCVQGSGHLKSHQTISFARRDCECASICPRTDQKICFDALDPKLFPFGRGALGTAITPLRSVAVDPKTIPMRSTVYIPAFVGLKTVHGTHDGCFVAEDRGLKVKGRHVDIFTGDPKTTKSVNRAVPSNQGVDVYIGVTQCAHYAKPRKH